MPPWSKTGYILVLNLAAECFKRHSKNPWCVVGGLEGKAPVSEGMTTGGMEKQHLLDRKCLGLSQVLASFAANLCMGHVLCLLVKLAGLRQEPSFNFSRYNTKKDYIGEQLPPPSSMVQKICGRTV